MSGRLQTMTRNNKTYLLVTLSFLLLYSCTNTEQPAAAFHFTLLEADTTNISFNNEITESDSVNVFDNEYMYNGSGVGVGDFNNDGLADIFFGGSMVSSKLYLNKGNFQFEDVTDKAGLQTNKWCTGISIVDINGDGFQDIYICASHSPDKNKRTNLLYINDGNLHFSEQAAAYGLADTGYSTQVAFFDYDKDGDLDMYLLHHRLYYALANSLAPKDTSGNSPAADRLYRNDGVLPGMGHPVFHDVSKEAGIKEDGYGLGIVITDVNNDNWPDVYAANDFIGNDVLWMNNKDGTFSNIIATSLKHQSYNSMGVDAADINNDALPDLAVVDMQPENNERKKMMFNAASQEKYDMGLRLGYEPSFVRNMLQLNNGIKKNNNKNEPFYSEIGQLAGISETDWSWSVLMADFDNDGWKDMHVTNGLAKDVTNNDYATFKNAHTRSNYTFAGNSNTSAPDKNNIALLRKNLDQYGSVKINNYFFQNNKDLTFTNTTQQTGLAVPSVSNGAAYVDLDNDGDLDLVVNNMNQPAFIWRNEIRKSATDSEHNFITLQLKGSAGNLFGLDSKVWLFNKGTIQYVEQAPVRGFSSSVDYRLHFGVGSTTVIDSLKIQWPDDKVQVLKNVPVNQVLPVKQEDAVKTVVQTGMIVSTLFNDVTGQTSVDFKHTEEQFYDFGYRRSLPQKYSQLGPDITTGDVNGDGLMDFFVGGAANQSGKLFIQKPGGSFVATNLVQGTKPEEDLGVLLFDADGDKDPDLLITGGSPEFGNNTLYNKPRLYSNDGKGNFTLLPDALPKEITDITKVIAVADYDADGDADIFIGGRLLSQKYPESPRSYVLRNDHGKFTDVTRQVCPALESPGMITGALFADFNNDKSPDLVICGEWMPVRFFKNEKGVFNEVTGKETLNGQWRSLEAADIDNDGDIDFVAGNLGWNNKFHITADRPLKLYAGDFDANNSLDIIPAYYIKDNRGDYELYPGLDRAQLADQIPVVKKKYLMSAEYAKTTMPELLNSISAKNLLEKDCAVTSTVWIENLGNNQFKQHALPVEAQFAPVNTIIANDLDNDGNIDLLLAGNEYGTEFSTGRYDACYGLFLKGNGKGTFTVQNPALSGFIVEGDVRSMKLLHCNDQKNIVVGFNNDALKCFRIQK
jgi:enediyne biosynthesis protein E4